MAVAAERKLQMLDSAKAIADLRSPPGNRLEALKGDRKGSWSIRINDQTIEYEVRERSNAA